MEDLYFEPDPACEEEEHDPTNVECICYRLTNPNYLDVVD